MGGVRVPLNFNLAALFPLLFPRSISKHTIETTNQPREWILLFDSKNLIDKQVVADG